ncbi:DoxX family protein [bacterium]|nr:DoxX family protein [bacterium]
MKQKILFGMSLIFGLMFINAGLNKFLNYIPVPDDLPEKLVKMMNAFTEIGWLMPLVGVTEIAGGILFIVPKTRALGAVIIFPIMIGILLVNITEPSGLPVALVLFAINLWVVFENKDKYFPMVR